MRELADDLSERNYAKDPLTVEEIELLIDAAGGVAVVLSPRNATAKERGWTTASPPTREAFVAAAAADNNLIRRPILLHDGGIVVGKDLPAIRSLLGASKR